MSDFRAIDPDALRAHYEWVRLLARQLVRDGDEADDLTQDVWKAALERPPRTDASPRGWLTVVTRHLAARRRGASERRLERESAAAPPASPRTADELVERAQIHRRIVDAILGLVELERTVILLRYFEGQDLDAIAKLVAAPKETVRTRLRRGLAHLRSSLERECGPGWTTLVASITRSSPTLGQTAVTTTFSGITLMSTTWKLVSAALIVFALIVAVAPMPWQSDNSDGIESHPQPVTEGSRIRKSAGSTPSIETPAGAPNGGKPEDRERPATKRPPSSQAVLKLVVIDAAGAPVRLAQVLVQESSRPIGSTIDLDSANRSASSAPRLWASNGWTDAGGNCSIAGVPLDCPLDVSAYADIGRVKVLGYSIDRVDPEPLHLTIARHAIVSGRVVDRLGNPLTARIRGHATAPNGEWIDTHERRTNAAGVFRLEPLRGILIGVDVDADGYEEVSRGVPFDEALSTSWDFVLEPRPLIRGRFMASGGGKIGLASHVAALQSRSPKRSFAVSIEATADDRRLNPNLPAVRDRSAKISFDDETFETYVQKEDRWISAWIGTRFLGTGSIDREDGTCEIVVAEVLSTPTPPIQVIVTATSVDGAPLQGCTVTAVRLQSESPEEVQAFDPVALADGQSARFTVDESGTWTIGVAAAGFCPISRRVAIVGPETHLEFRLEPAAATLTGRVVAPDGQPIAGAVVRPYSSSGEIVTSGTKWRFATTDQDGRFTTTGFAAGAYDIVISADGWAPSASRIALREGSNEIVVTLQRGVEIQIRSTTCEGPFVWVISDQNGAKVVDDEHSFVRSYGRPKFRLMPGRYRLELRVPHFKPTDVSFRAAEGLVIEISPQPES